jgi:hypothetical protein
MNERRLSRFDDGIVVREGAMVTWDIQRDGRAWGEEAMSRYQMTLRERRWWARLYGTEEERLTMLALLLENVGADEAVRLGSASTWRGAVAALNEEQRGPGNPFKAIAERLRCTAVPLSTQMISDSRSSLRSRPSTV